VKIKQSQGKSERGFRPSPRMKSSKNHKNQAKSSQVLTRFSPFATQDKDKDKDKEMDDQDYDKEK
jgi:hypothetical protein